jgi:hypothetical protein
VSSNWLGQWADDLREYKIREPAITHKLLLHNRSFGWKRLVIKALKMLIRKEEVDEEISA